MLCTGDTWTCKVKMHVEEIDLCRKGEMHDLTDDNVVNKVIDDLNHNKYHVAIIAPPCNTHSRALSASKFGPQI